MAQAATSLCAGSLDAKTDIEMLCACPMVSTSTTNSGSTFVNGLSAATPYFTNNNLSADGFREEDEDEDDVDKFYPADEDDFTQASDCDSQIQYYQSSPSMVFVDPISNLEGSTFSLQHGNPVGNQLSGICAGRDDKATILEESKGTSSTKNTQTRDYDTIELVPNNIDTCHMQNTHMEIFHVGIVSSGESANTNETNNSSVMLEARSPDHRESNRSVAHRDLGHDGKPMEVPPGQDRKATQVSGVKHRLVNKEKPIRKKARTSKQQQQQQQQQTPLAKGSDAFTAVLSQTDTEAKAPPRRRGRPPGPKKGDSKAARLPKRGKDAGKLTAKGTRSRKTTTDNSPQGLLAELRVASKIGFPAGGDQSDSHVIQRKDVISEMNSSKMPDERQYTTGLSPSQATKENIKKESSVVRRNPNSSSDSDSASGGGQGSLIRRKDMLWTKDEDDALAAGVQALIARTNQNHPALDGRPYISQEEWEQISSEFMGGKRNTRQCRRRWARMKKMSSLQPPPKQGERWTPEEDEILRQAAVQEQHLSQRYKWSWIARKYFNSTRSSEQCRTRWNVRVKHPDWTAEDDELIVSMRTKGKSWADISKQFPSRPTVTIKRRWMKLESERKLKEDPVWGGWNEEEVDMLIKAVARAGDVHWSEVDHLLSSYQHLQGRYEQELPVSKVQHAMPKKTKYDDVS